MQPLRSRLFLALIVSAASLAAQSALTTSSNTTTRNGVTTGTMHLSPRRFFGAAVTDAPYSAQRIIEQVQVGSDGTRFTTNSQQETVYRDSAGRTRIERPMMMGPRGASIESPLLVEITDPVAGVGYTLDTQNKIAHKYALQVPPRLAKLRESSGGSGGGAATNAVLSGVFSAELQAPPPQAPPPPLGARIAGDHNQPQPAVAREDLGTQSIEGVLAKGSRIVTTWPTGSQGNDRPFQIISETWYSEDLKLQVLSKNVDPRSGENTTRIVNINRSEPMPSLFVPPPDYTISEETGPFSIEWTGSAK